MYLQCEPKSQASLRKEESCRLVHSNIAFVTFSNTGSGCRSVEFIPSHRLEILIMKHHFLVALNSLSSWGIANTTHTCLENSGSNGADSTCRVRNIEYQYLRVSLLAHTRVCVYLFLFVPASEGMQAHASLSDTCTNINTRATHKSKLIQLSDPADACEKH